MLPIVVLFLLIVSLNGVICNTTHHYYVVPSDDIPCPAYPCNTLLNCIQNSSQCFTSDTTVAFLPEVYQVPGNQAVVIKSVSNLTIIGVGDEYLAVIWCNGSTVFVFENVTNLRIANVAFVFCGAQIGPISAAIDSYQSFYKVAPQLHVALLLVHVQSIELSRVSVQNSTGYGLMGINVLGDSYILGSSFLFNNYRTLNQEYCSKASFTLYCQGGNAFFLFADPTSQPVNLSQTMTLSIHSAHFISGVDITRANQLLPSEYVSGGGGLSVVFAQSKYFVRVALIEVVSTQNVGILGANIFVVSYSCAHSSFIIVNSSSTLGNHELMTRLSPRYRYHETITVGAGLSYHYGWLEAPHAKIEISTDYPLPLLYISQSTFYSNIASIGTAVYIFLSSPTAMSGVQQITVQDCSFFNNTGYRSIMHVQEVLKCQGMGFEITLRNFLFIANGNPNYWSNSVHYSDSPSSIPSTSLFGVLATYDVQNLAIINGTFHSNSLTGLLALGTSQIHFSGRVIFVNNRAPLAGGGMAINGNAAVYLTNDTVVFLIENRAGWAGGGIYVSDIDYSSSDTNPSCIFQGETSNPCDTNAQIVMQGNFANSGYDVYGGYVDECIVNSHQGLASCSSTTLFNTLFNLTDVKYAWSTHTLVASSAIKVCFCLNQEWVQYYYSDRLPRAILPQERGLVCGPNANVHVFMYRGEELKVPATVVGQREGITDGLVKTILIQRENASYWFELAPLQDSQWVSFGCTNVTYTVYSWPEIHVSAVIGVYVGSMDKFKDTFNALTITLLPCPPGFQLSNETGGCVCIYVLQERNMTCEINNQTITRFGSIWINASSAAASSTKEGRNGIIVHDHCPSDYCKSTHTTIILSNPNEQCAFKHSGTLCGGCITNHSLTLGNPHCEQCSNVGLLWIILFIAFGILLVALLISCNLTVSMGTINGLIFYANIVRANHIIFFAPEDMNHNIFKQILAVFVAWLNLDFGIEICFFNGMDAFVQTWLQFAFPFFVWTLVGITIMLCRYSITVVKLVGRNIVPVLATLFVLSYAKLQRTIITTFSFTSLESYYLDGSSTTLLTVWLYDGNVPFLKGKHLYLLAMASAVSLLFIIPFTILVLFAPCLQASTNHWALKWVIRFKPLLDAYQGPYKDKFRWWTGLMLVVRIILFIAFAANSLGDPNLNLLFTVAVMTCLLAFAWNAGQVYKSLYINILETSFIVNLEVLSVWTLLNRSNENQYGKSQDIAIYISVGFALATFVGILAYHGYLALKKQRVFRLCKRAEHPLELPNVVELSDDSVAEIPNPNVPTTFIDLREPLLTD